MKWVNSNEKLFYFTLKAFFVLKIFRLFGRIKKPLDLKDQVSFQIYDAKLGKQTIAIQVLPNISRSKGDQRKRFGQLIEYNMRTIFLEKSYMKCGGETIPRPFSKNQN